MLLTDFKLVMELPLDQVVVVLDRELMALVQQGKDYLIFWTLEPIYKFRPLLGADGKNCNRRENKKNC